VSHGEFIVPYQKYVKSMANLIRVGTRVRMRLDVDDPPERRYSGVVTGIGNTDSYRWPNSKWRCLMVRWDEDIGTSEHQSRVSPWEIDPSVSIPPLSIQSSPRMKKLQTGLQSTAPENPVTGVFGLLDSEESLRSSKVLQGQENESLASPFRISDARTRVLDFEMQNPAYRSLAPVQGRKAYNDGFELSRVHHQAYMGFKEANQFLEVLQGREICKLKSLAGKPEFKVVAGKPFLSCSSLNQDQPRKFNTSPPQSLYVSYGEVQSGQTLAAHCFMRNIENGLTKIEEISASPNPWKHQVHKQGSLVGRAIDLSRLTNYGDLLDELEKLFGMKGLLRDPNRGWRILYTDSENDVMAIGDEPWHEFIDVVSKIHIYTEEEVEKMTAAGIMTDDTQSCLEQSPAVMEASKSSSIGGPDSSPTVLSI
ncbi:hypothetical protein CRG98_027645, partial [Punica granatum]